MKRRKFFGIYLLFLGSCTVIKNNPISNLFNSNVPRPEKLRFAVTDVQGMSELQRDYEPFRIALEEVLEEKIEFFPTNNFTEAGAALQLERVDFLLAGPSEYVIVKARTNAIPVVALTRPGFHSVIAVRADSGIKSLTQLKGKTIAMREVGSISGHLGPAKMLIDAGLNLQSDLKIVMLEDEGLKALKNGKVDAWGGSIFRYKRTLQAEGVSEKVLPAIATGPLLPNDVFMADSKLDPAWIEEMRSRMLKNQEKLMQALLSTKVLATRFQGSKLVPANDADYNMVREMYQATGQGNFLQ